MHGDAILLMLAAILLIWGGLCASVVALVRMTPPFQAGESFSDVELAKPHSGLSDEDFIA